jgi:hypothetical protein
LIALLEDCGCSVGVERRHHGEWHIERRRHEVVGTREALWRNTDDGECLATEADLAANDRGIGAELLAPCLIRKHDDGIAPDAIFIRNEPTPQRRPNVEEVEEICADRLAERPLRWLVTPQTEAGNHAVERRQPFEALRAIAEIGVIGIRQLDVAVFACGRRTDDVHQPARIGNRQRAKDQAVRDAEHGGIGAHADGNRQDCRERESRILRQHPCAVPDVLPDGFEHQMPAS